MTTLVMIRTAVVFCALVGIPLGILAARRNGFATALRPVLDIMQTIPPFVYLVPIVMLFGVGMVPGIVATIIFALPPVIRLTNLGIRGVPGELVEAAYAFGSTPRRCCGRCRSRSRCAPSWRASTRSEEHTSELQS